MTLTIIIAIVQFLAGLALLLTLVSWIDSIGKRVTKIEKTLLGSAEYQAYLRGARPDPRD